MTDNSWYDTLESKIYNKIDKYIDRENGEEVYVTTDEVNVSDTEFPCVWVHELEYLEMWQDLTNKTVNGIMYNMQIDVFATTKEEARRLMRYALDGMKTLMFNVSMMPLVIQSSADIYHSVARFRRVFGAGDKI